MAGVINDLIREIVVEMGATAITITHDMTTVARVADRVAMLHGGTAALDRRRLGRLRDSDDPYLRQFVEGRADGPIATAALNSRRVRVCAKRAEVLTWR